MHTLENKMVDILLDLREHHKLAGLKLSFEDEGALTDESVIFMRIAQKAGVPVSVKIGGCNARKDIYDAVTLGASKIVAPMVETPYACKLFINALHAMYPEWHEAGIKAYVNVETYTGCENLDAMLALPEAEYLSGCVVGRVDMVGSMNLPRNAVNTDDVFAYAYGVADKMKKTGREFLIGGSISSEAMPFLERLPEGALKYFETRNVIFNVEAKDCDINIALVKAMNFELSWLQYKQKKHGFVAYKDDTRIKMMTERFERNCKECGL